MATDLPDVVLGAAENARLNRGALARAGVVTEHGCVSNSLPEAASYCAEGRDDDRPDATSTLVRQAGCPRGAEEHEATREDPTATKRWREEQEDERLRTHGTNGACMRPATSDSRPPGQGTLVIAPLVWGEPELPDLVFDRGVLPQVIVAADVVYAPEAYEPLLRTLLQLMPDTTGSVDQAARVGSDMLAPTTDPVLVLAHRHRNAQDGLFFSAFEQHFDAMDLLDEGGGYGVGCSLPDPACGSLPTWVLNVLGGETAVSTWRPYCSDVRVIVARRKPTDEKRSAVGGPKE